MNGNISFIGWGRMNARKRTSICEFDHKSDCILELYEKLNVQYLGIAEISKETGNSKEQRYLINRKNTGAPGWLIQDNPNGKYRLGTRILRHDIHKITQSITTGRTHRKGNEMPER